MSWLITPELKTVEGIPWEQIPSALRWSPAEISTALWLDATDTSTVTLVGGAVSQWNDKSGNNRNATQGTAGSRPGYNATGLNSKGAVTFDGSSQFMTVADFYMSDWCMIAVARHASETTDGTFAAKWAAAGNQREYIFRINSSNKLIGLKSADGGSGGGQIFSTTANAGTSFGVYGFYKNDTTAQLSINGTAETFTFTNSTVFDGTSAIGIGAEPSGFFERLNGAIQQLVFVPGAQSVDTFQKLEGWAAWSSGLQSNLPNDHPYKVNPPAP